MHDYSELISSLQQLNQAQKLMLRKSFPDFTPTQFAIMGFLFKFETLKVNDIAQKLRIDQSMASRSLKNLQSNDLVKREVNPEDTRSALFSLSDKGKKAIQKSQQEYSEVVEKVVSTWDEEKLALANSVIKELAEKMLEETQ